MIPPKNWIVLIVLFLSGSVHAQDLIITAESDSIKCHITKVEEDFISFSYLKEGKTEYTSIKKNDINSYQFAYFEKKEIPKRKSYSFRPSHWRILFRGGYSWMTGAIGDGTNIYKDYARGFKHGYHVGTEIDYFFGEYFGLGGKFTFYNNKNELNLSSVGEKGKMSDNAKYLYIAPNFVGRLMDRKGKNTVFFDFSLGYFSYHNDGVVQYEKIMTDWKCAGIQIGIGYERALSKNFSIGGGFSLLRACTKKLKYTAMGKKWTEELDELKDFDRLDFSLLLVFNAGKR
ncbi:MAG: hypothetical protein PUB21_07085 [Bacteroidales bacterium]|nr:hypothetical protein [Bacteroidales bacterium]